jgi:hypothetical protein
MPSKKVLAVFFPSFSVILGSVATHKGSTRGTSFARAINPK